MIEVRDLVKKYRKANDVALDNVSLSIREGEFFGLLGPNAAGKTTLISVIAGLLKINSGEVFLNDVNVKTHPADVKKYIGLSIPFEKSSRIDTHNSSASPIQTESQYSNIESGLELACIPPNITLIPLFL